MYEDKPTMTELVEAVREFLETRIMNMIDEHTAYHTRVAVNVLKMVERELESSPTLELEEIERLKGVMAFDGTLQDQNRELCRRIREGEIDLQDPKLVKHLKQTTLGKLSVDNPGYSTYQKILEST